ncbi:MAG TPA: AAA family ATPase [Chitinispirillaceae bacterium]|nr:AAA family ATPase [Chitinispirillaceae bacterium]
MPDSNDLIKNDLFESNREELLRKTAPLADRMRPRTLDEYIGQEHIIGAGRLLRRAIQIDQLSSLIFYGPPGTGKTTLARIIANTTKAQFLSLNAVLSGVKDIRESIDTARKTLSLYGRRTILFIDEVHRFNKSQQDALLPHVENGTIILIGATTENPYFEVNKALVSRSRIFQLIQLTEKDLKAVAVQAVNDKERGYGKKKIIIEDDALDHLVKVANGDARSVLNGLELAVETTKPDSSGGIRISRDIAEESIQKRAVLYDKDGDVHYDTISAFIKSIRGSDPDAALYWMSKMIYAGEDPRFIFRRMMILACEDVGMADPKALGVVVNSARAFDYVGLPEGRYHLAHACLYLATAPKSNSSMAFFDALDAVSNENKDDIPDHLRDANRDKNGLGHGAGYLYPHAYRDHWVAQQYLPSSLQGKVFYQPSDQGCEKEIGQRVARFREAQLEAMIEEDDSSPLTYDEKDGKKENRSKEWIDRSLGNRGVQLGKIRKQVLSRAMLNKDSLVLDLNARTGMLTFEAARIAVNGAVWALAHDNKSLKTVKAVAERFDLLSRPQIVLSSMNSFEKDLKTAAGENVRFDAIIGRNIISRCSEKKELFLRIAKLLNKSGRIVLAESVSSEGQKLSDLIDQSKIDPDLFKFLTEAQTGLFSDSSDSMVNWNSDSLKIELNDIDKIEISYNRQVENVQKRISGTDVNFWFRTTDGSKRRSLGSRIAEHCSEKQFQKLKNAIVLQLSNKIVNWKTVYLYITAINK